MYMEVMRIYSEVDIDEKLYSVLMSEEEMYLFSDIQREFTGSKIKDALLFSEIDQEENKGLKTAAKVADVAGVGTLVGTGAYVLNKQHQAAQEISKKYGNQVTGGVFNPTLSGMDGTKSGKGVEVFKKYKQRLGKVGKIGAGVGISLGALAAGLHIASKKKNSQS